MNIFKNILGKTPQPKKSILHKVGSNISLDIIKETDTIILGQQKTDMNTINTVVSLLNLQTNQMIGKSTHIPVLLSKRSGHRLVSILYPIDRACEGPKEVIDLDFWVWAVLRSVVFRAIYYAHYCK